MAQVRERVNKVDTVDMGLPAHGSRKERGRQGRHGRHHTWRGVSAHGSSLQTGRQGRHGRQGDLCLWLKLGNG
jgi:hypothetical protein